MILLTNYGAPGEIRTPDRPVRSRVLYPAELRMHSQRAILPDRHNNASSDYYSSGHK